MQVKIYEELPKCALDIRTEVFIHEQGFEYELDERDKLATHFVVFDTQTPIATCRVFFDLELNAYLVGRICVLKAYRGQKIGSLLMQTAEILFGKRVGKGFVCARNAPRFLFMKSADIWRTGKSFTRSGVRTV